jgi:hypothetical protein
MFIPGGCFYIVKFDDADGADGEIFDEFADLKVIRVRSTAKHCLMSWLTANLTSDCSS